MYKATHGLVDCVRINYEFKKANFQQLVVVLFESVLGFL
jgi:hypothetical protein